jgi:hypothetical protein
MFRTFTLKVIRQMHFAEYSEICYGVTFKEVAIKYTEHSFSLKNVWNNACAIQELKEVFEK